MTTATRMLGGVEWRTEWPDLFAFATGQPAPRRGSWRGQLRRDLLSREMWGLWLLGVGYVVLGIYTNHPVGVGVTCIGGIVLASGVLAFLSVSRRFAVSQVVQGTVEGAASRGRHRVRLDDDSRVVLVSLPESVREVTSKGRLEVLALHDPKSSVSTVIGWRAS